MRIANGHFSTTIQGTLGKGNLQLGELMTRMSRGERLLRPSDDPIASVRLRMLERDAVMLKQYRSNISALGIRLQQNETQLDGMLDSVMSAKDLVLWALDGSNTPEDLNAMSSSMRTLRDTLLTSANARNSEGHYLFSGTATSTAPIAYDPAQPAGARYSFAGNTSQQQVVVGNGITQAGNVSVDNVAEVLNQMDAALALMEDPTVNVNDPAVRATLAAAERALDDGIGSLSSRIAQLGGAQNTLRVLDDSHASAQVSNGEALQRVGGLDVVETYDQLTRHTVAIQATYKVYGQIMQLNPFQLL
ncbi:flagellar hook-associated protein 3 [Xanthomonas sp. XNM01]|uniref:flagellin N-terminal helical domain-containing protein n=1 Tax=Xanthomonas sp. XNM01 TaxID=2769289 RepID=UPI00178014F6|nr:flagellar hook-associated protein 3 [Xanthomonas sp. XNM01]MBD9370953.1 flagellar hook-associated protein 3 [Xanthomonas sp. XNM01]